jgi:hypothetical protein
VEPCHHEQDAGRRQSWSLLLKSPSFAAADIARAPSDLLGPVGERRGGGEDPLRLPATGSSACREMTQGDRRRQAPSSERLGRKKIGREHRWPAMTAVGGLDRRSNARDRRRPWPPGALCSGVLENIARPRASASVLPMQGRGSVCAPCFSLRCPTAFASRRGRSMRGGAAARKKLVREVERGRGGWEERGKRGSIGLGRCVGKRKQGFTPKSPCQPAQARPHPTTHVFYSGKKGKNLS